jgi:hypothetical protein
MRSGTAGTIDLASIFLVYGSGRSGDPYSQSQSNTTVHFFSGKREFPDVTITSDSCDIKCVFDLIDEGE